MDFIYYYRTSDGIRHEAEIGAPSRDEAFAALRKQGIRPIKMMEKNPRPVKKGVRKRTVFAVVCLAALIAGFSTWFFMRAQPSSEPAAAQKSSSGVVGNRIAATMLPRQTIAGNRFRIEQAARDLFKHPSESLLAQFAEPGVHVEIPELTPELVKDFLQTIQEPIFYTADELTEHIDLKRIVTGMKREMQSYLQSGGTVEQYVGELIKRQKMEQAYRDKAEKRLSELLKGKDRSQSYAYWLKANASLHAMGIAPLELPNELRAFQMSLDIDSEEGVPTISPQ